MKIITLNRSVVLEFTTDSNLIVQIPMNSGKKYVLSDGMCEYVFKTYGSRAAVITEDLAQHIKRYRGQSLDNKSLLAIREGGAGDLLFITPSFRHLSQKFPTSTLGLACSPVYHSLLRNSNLISELYPHVLSLEDFDKYDYFITFEGIIEGNSEAKTVNAYELFAQRFNIDFEEIDDKQPSVQISAETDAYWETVLPESLNKSRKIGFQMRASSPVRTLPPTKNAEILKKLNDKGYLPFLIDAHQKRGDTDRFIAAYGLKGKVINAAHFSDNFERMSGLISKMDLFIGPDSSGLHIAAAFNIPLIGLYGPFRSDIRLQHYNNAVGIDVIPDKCKGGCFMHTYDLCEFAHNLGKPYAPCWDLLGTDTVVAEVELLHENILGDFK